MLALKRPGRLLLAAALAYVVAASAAAQGFAAPQSGRDQKLVWADCGDGWQCAALEVPRDYRRPKGNTFTLAITRLPARDLADRRGVLFVNFGGPGGTVVESLHAFGADLFAAANQHLDIVGVDPRGVGLTQPSVDCEANQETEGIYSQPFPIPLALDARALVRKSRAYVERCKDLNGEVLRYLSTVNTARDMDRVREAMGERKLNYFGFSYGTYLGSTYATLFPKRYRAMVLDGPVDLDAYGNRPMENLREQSDGFERALARFFQACAANQAFCGFGGSDPLAAFDLLVAQANATPLPAAGADPVDGDDVIAGAALAMYAKQFWPFLVDALQLASAGDGTGFRFLADAFYGKNGDGTFDPGLDRYFLIGALDQRYKDDVDLYLDAGNHAWGLFEHAWWNSGYAELSYGLFDVRPNDVYRGPFRGSKRAPTMLIVVTRYDPATPYRGGLRTAAQLGNTRLLTMQGDGHTAYGGNSACIDAAVDAYVESLTLPPLGTVCQQQVPFGLTSLFRTGIASLGLAELWRAAPHGGGR